MKKYFSLLYSLIISISVIAQSSSLQADFGLTPVDDISEQTFVARDGDQKVVLMSYSENDPVVLHYDQANASAIGLTGGGTFFVAARFPAAMVAPYPDYELQSVDIYIYHLPYSITLKIWGAGSNFNPGLLLHEQVVSPSFGWNHIELSTPVLLDGTDIWIGYTVTHYVNDYPAGCDAGPAHPEGCWISFEGFSWSRLYQLNPQLNYNWNIRGNLFPSIILAIEDSYTIDDSLTGNNDGILDPGETATLTMMVNNNGLEKLFNIQSSLTSNDTLISVMNGSHLLPELEAGGSAAIEFVVSAHEFAPYGCPVDLEVLAFDLIPGNYTATQTITIPLGPEYLMPGALSVDPETLNTTWTVPEIPSLIVETQLLNETWSTYSFNTNGWTFEPSAGNWQIDFFYGNPGFSAKFASTPARTNYGFSLVSAEFDATLMPLVAIDYDLSLQNYSLATLEQLSVEVWDGDQWIALANYDNTQGNKPWTTYSHDITEHVSGNLFQLRFRAFGVNSANLIRWNIDNIKIHGLIEDGALYGLTGYEVFLDGEPVGIAASNQFGISPELVNFGQLHTASVRALYGNHKSHMISTNFYSLYPYEPCMLEGEDAGHAVTLVWVHPNECVEDIAVQPSGFKIYRNAMQIANASAQTLTFTDEWLAAGSYNYSIYAVYNVAGQVREVLHAGPLEVEVSTEIVLDIKLLLEGAFNAGDTPLMLTSINQEIPLSQPFNPELPHFGNPMPVWFYEGQENLAVMPENVVDWVLVEIRNSHDGMILSRQAALLLNSGQIVDVNNQEIIFNTTYTHKIYLALYHRNHLPVMSAGTLVKSAGIYSWDFTDAQTKAYGLVLKDLGNGYFGMPGGDGNGDGTINDADIIQVWNQQAGYAGYLAGDYSLNGQVQNQDKNNIWNPNQGMVMSIIEDVSNVMKIVDAFGLAGENLTIDIEITNFDTFNAFQADIAFPEGFDYVAGSNVLNPARAVDHTIQSNILPGTNIYRMICYSLSNTNFLGNSGVITSFILTTPSTTGSYIFTPENALMGNHLGLDVLTGTMAGTITLLETLDELKPVNTGSRSFREIEKDIAGRNTLIYWRFANPMVISSTPAVLKFDIEIKSEQPGTFHRDMQVYFEYNAEVFGSNVRNNGKIILEKTGIMSEELSPGVFKYNWVNEGGNIPGADNTGSIYAVLSEYISNQPPSPDHHTLLPDEWTGFARVQIEILNTGFAGIQFSGNLMNGGQFLFDENGGPLAYAPTAVYENDLLDFEIIFCDPPVDLHASVTESNSAILNWTAASNETYWNLLWGEAGFNPETSGTLVEGIITTSYNLTSLNPETDYEFYVQAVCSEFSVSAWAGPTLFTTSGVDQHLIFDSLNVDQGQNLCFGALETIIVNDLTVASGAILSLIAGSQINILPNSLIQNGSQFLARIDTTGTFCEQPANLLHVKEETMILVQQKPERTKENANHLFTVFPNPTSGIFRLKLKEMNFSDPIFIEVFSTLGERLLHAQIDGKEQVEFSLNNHPAGVYLIRVMTGDQIGIEKLIKQGF